MDLGDRSAEVQRILDQALETNGLQSWERFVECAQPIVASALRRVLSRWHNPRNDEVEDMVQESFLKLCANDYRFLRRFRSAHPSALAAYLRTVASTVVVDGYRARSSQKRGSDANAVAMDDVEVAVGSSQAVEAVERRLLIARIERCLSSQKERDRHVFWLYYRQGLTVKAISTIHLIELTSSGVESLIRRLTLAVRKCLKVTAIGQISEVVKGNPR
jgi:RNA polymerase sigma-70 factor, ECF subfamily